MEREGNMRKLLIFVFVVIAVGSGDLNAGCTMNEVCRDLLDSIVVQRGGSVHTTITWESDSEPSVLDFYKVIRSQDPEFSTYVVVELVQPDYECGPSAAAYPGRKTKPPPCPIPSRSSPYSLTPASAVGQMTRPAAHERRP